MFGTQGFIFRKQSGRPKSLLILIHVKRTIPYLYTHPSSWRWSLGFETCRRHQKL